MEYTSIHIHSQLSNNILMDSASTTKDYIATAKEKGLHGLIITEHGATLGWYKKKKEIEESGFKYVHAFEGYTRANQDDKNNYHILVYGLNNEGRKEVNQLISNAYKEDHFYKRPTFFIDELFNCSNIAISTACLATAFKEKNKDNYVFKKMLEWGLQNKDRFFLEIQPHNIPEQIEHNKFIIEMSKKYGFKLVVTNDVHYHNKTSGELRQEKQKAQKMPFSYEDGLDLEMKSYSEMYTSLLNIGISPEIAKEALENTNIIYDIAEEYTIDKNFKMPNIYPNATKTMSERCIKNFKNKVLSVYSNQHINDISNRIIQEIQVIHKLKSSSYMLMIADWVNGLRDNGIFPGLGRGSVNGSIVAYLLGITEIDPIKFGTLFFRFMNPEKISMPDVDTDIESDRQYEAKSWFYNKKGLQCSEIITFGKDLEKGAIRSMGRSYGMELDDVEKILANISEYRKEEEYQDFFNKVDSLDGFIRSIGIHAGGMLVSDLDIEKEIGIITSFDKDMNIRRRVTQLDMRELDELGYVKVDALGLANIGAINRVCNYLGIKRPSPDTIDFEDMNVWNHILNSKHGTMIFQFEKDQAFNHLKRALSNIKNMKKLDIMTAVSGVIRPCGDSIREDLFTGKVNDTGSEIINKRFAYNNSYLIYQEDFMNFLTEFSGYSNAESDYVRKCVSSDSLISMSDGSQKFIKDICVGDYVLSVDKNGKIIKSKVTNKWNNGIKKVYKLSTKHGYSIKTTLDHKILCEDNFYELKNINKNMFVYTPLLNNTHSDGLRGNQRIEWKTAFMLGLLLGDGSIAKDKLCFVNNEIELINFYMDCVKSYFRHSQPEFTISYQDGITVDKIYKCEIKTLEHRKFIRNLIRKHDINCLSGDKKIPIEILKYQESKPLIALLAGLFNTDGYVCNLDSSIEYSTKSKQLALDIKNSLLKLGIYSYIYKKPVKGYDYNMSVVRLVGSDSYKNFLNKISEYIIGKKKDEFKRACMEVLNNELQYGYILPSYHTKEIKKAVESSPYSFRELFYPMEYKSNYNISSEKSFKIIQKLYCPDTYKLLLSDLLPIKVENIEYYDECEVYDIEVENTHNFICDGLVVHNCISKKGGTDKIVGELKERFPKYFMEHYGETPENTEKVLNHVAKIMKDAENYAFNIAHARPYTITGFLCAYFRCYYPKEFITASLNTFKNKKEKIKAIYTYIQEETDIKIESPVFGNASQEYSYDKEKNIIYEGLAGLKGVSKNADMALKEIPITIDNFLDLLVFIKEHELKLSQKDLSVLIKIDFFRNFGKQKYLLNIIDIFFNDIKYNFKNSEKTKDKKIGLIKEKIALLDPEDEFNYAEKMKNELIICGRTSKTMDWLEFNALFILSLEHPYPSRYILKGFNMKNGEIEIYKIDRKDMIDIDESDVIVVNSIVDKERKQLVDGKWQGTGIFDPYIKSMSKVEF